ncbi:hypothetical protein HMPREF3138_10540 [Serratia sp. HMSC15F11]|nr:hypothetical protein HMPREF3138_10540 [Serratia sp. HMSC15F11]
MVIGLEAIKIFYRRYINLVFRIHYIIARGATCWLSIWMVLGVMDIILKSRLQMKVPAFLPESLSFGLGKINLDCFLLALSAWI